ncbi:HAD family phosphatase [Candidatus Micrarchaeota archaeon]|nr:HAD family phosphatase [Candidatus Micrarchaeota archaeon]
MNAVIFDFDGVILDSEPQHHESFRRLFEAHAVAFSETPDDFTGIGARDNIKRVYQNAGIDLAEEKLGALNLERDLLYLEVMAETGIRILPGAKELVMALKAQKIPIALASSTNAAVLEKILPQIGLSKSFDVVVGGDQVQNGKPAPDIFLLAAKKLGVVPTDCVVIEDSNAGVQAANAAGMKVVMVRNDRIAQQKQNADVFFDSMVGLNMEFLFSI